MADPKYENLPGIDRDQPDVYETSDLPESDQDQHPEGEEANGESVEDINISATEAFGRFKGKTLESGRIDFSDKVGKSRRTGYDVPEYEIVGDDERKETPQQKYQRLQHEIRELQEEVQQIQEGVKADASTEKLAAVPMTKQVEYLQQQLGELNLDKLLGEKGLLSLGDPQGALQKRLITEIEAFQSGSAPGDSKTVPEASGGDANCVTYQLYYKPEQAKFSHNARIADIEERVERMEAVVGNNPERLSALTQDTHNKSLVGAVAVLAAKTKLLDPTQVEQVEGRLAAISQKLGQISEKKDSVEDVEKLNKISELYDLVKKWDTMANSLPHVADRLTALKNLHEQALQFSQALTHLDTAQQQISHHLGVHGDMLKQVQKTLTENLASIKANTESLDSRITALQKK